MSGIPQLERIVFYSGELLTADDLTALDDNNRQLRWLHNRSLHNWGIGFGLDVQGSRGDTSVTVNPGYAVDSSGREIILSNPVKQPIPAVSGPATYYLVANYVDDANEPVEEQRSATACSPGGAVRLSNAPAILWKTSNLLILGLDVVLAQVSIQNCVLSQPPSGAARRYATCGSPFFHQSWPTRREGYLVDPLDAGWHEIWIHRPYRYFHGPVPVDTALYGANHRQPLPRRRAAHRHPRPANHHWRIAHGVHPSGGTAFFARRESSSRCQRLDEPDRLPRLGRFVDGSRGITCSQQLPPASSI